jgi:N-acetylmuramoyl-L-alanine amidase CwlA
MEIKEMLLTHNRPYTKRKKTTAVAVHWVGNPNTSAEANRNYFQNTDRAVSSNFIVGLKGEVIRCIPEDEVSWCTNQANGYTVSIETCHPDNTGVFNEATYNSLVELTAMLCKKYDLNPLNGGVIRHFDVTGKVCPKCFVAKKYGGSDDNNLTRYTKFKNDVAMAMKPTPTVTELPYLVQIASSDGFVNIRKTPSWDDSDIVDVIKNGYTKYTIVEEKTLDGVKFGRLKSGIGWIALSCTTKVV